MAGVVLVEDVLSISGVRIVHRVDAVPVPGDGEDQRRAVVLAGDDATKRTTPVGPAGSPDDQWLAGCDARFV